MKASAKRAISVAVDEAAHGDRLGVGPHVLVGDDHGHAAPAARRATAQSVGAELVGVDDVDAFAAQQARSG